MAFDLPTFNADDDDERLALNVTIDGTDHRLLIKPCTAHDFPQMEKLRDDYVGLLLGQTSPIEFAKATGMATTQDVFRLTLSDVYDQLMEAGATVNLINRCAFTALMWHASGGNNDAALAAWTGKARSPRTPSGKDGDAASATSSASTRSTSTRRKSSPASKPARRTSGAKSSATST